ncbi:ROK family transcriptional regulator [Glutamicibacter endophyticus]|uniref:ROK family transcriptional regulator n=1 Tax=Glutamicibacter endophyticus TaxID=1522174 RepID=UPI003AF000BA
MKSSPGPRRDLARRTASLPAHGRELNLSLLLQHLHTQGPMSRAELARASGLTRVTISDLVSELLTRGHVVELGQNAQGRPGKPAIMLDLNRTGLQIIGIDLADSAVMRAAVMDLDGNILTRIQLLTNDETGQQAAAQVIELTTKAIAAATEKIIGIGVGSPGIVSDAGVILTAPNFGWKDFDLHTLLESRFNLPVVVGNDADCAVMGEHTFGSGGSHMMLVKIGRGVGCGSIVNGTPVRGANSASGEIGHVVVGTDQGPECDCGRRGCVESYTAIPALRAALGQQPASGDKEAHRRAVLHGAGERLGIALAPVVSVLDIENLVLAGPAEYIDADVLGAVRETIAARTNTEQRPRFEVQLCEHPDDIVLRGAAVNVLFEQLGVA